MYSRVCSVVLLTLSSSVVSAQQSVPRIGGDPARDQRQTMQARLLLATDPDLAAFNIGVIVTDRVAEIWGPVPSAEVAFRAELCVRTMIELAEVRSRLFVNELVEPTPRPLKVDVPPLILPDRVPPKLPVEPLPIPSAPGLLSVQAKESPPTQVNKLPVSVTLPMFGLPQVDAGVETERELTEAIRTFLKSKAAFRSVRFTLQERRVFLNAPEQDTDALHEAARGISRLPHVEGVILSDKTLPR